MKLTHHAAAILLAHAREVPKGQFKVAEDLTYDLTAFRIPGDAENWRVFRWSDGAVSIRYPTRASIYRELGLETLQWLS